MAKRSLATGANKTNVLEMMERIEAEPIQVRSLVREEIEKMMKMAGSRNCGYDVQQHGIIQPGQGMHKTRPHESKFQAKWGCR
jgi:hypothetical protein